MILYQRYFSRSLMFLSIFFVIFFLFIQSNLGFKWIFNFTNRFFLGLKIEEISGNWYDFKFKNIRYNIAGSSIQADSVHVVLDIRSLFSISTIFKEIETKNVIISLKKNTSTDILQKNIIADSVKKSVFIKYPIFFKRIHADKILLKSSKINIFISNFFSGIKLINNNIIFSPTHINNLRIVSLHPHLKKKNTNNKLNTNHSIFQFNTFHKYVYFFLNKPKSFLPLNIHLTFLKCHNVYFNNYKKINFFQIAFKSQIKNNILKIKKLKIKSSLLSITSYGKLIINDNYSILCHIKNRILMPKFQNKIINVLFSASINNKMTFKLKLKSSNLYKVNMLGRINLISLNHYFYLKNILSVKGMPSFFIGFYGSGNSKKIYLKKINFFSIKKKLFHKKIKYIKNDIKKSQYILDLLGKISLLGQSNNNMYNLCIPKMNLNGYFMKKKLSILGSLYYRNFNLLRTPGINLFLGKNKLYLKGFLGKKYNISSSFFIKNLDYFYPDIKGAIKSKIHFYNNRFPTITSSVRGSHVKLNNISFKSINIITNMNFKNTFLGKISAHVKKIRFFNFYFDYFHICTVLNRKDKNFYFSLKSDFFRTNLVLKNILNKKTRNWKIVFTKINIKNFWGPVISKKIPQIYFHGSSSKINNFYRKDLKIKNAFFYFINKTQISLFKIFNESFVSFNSKLFLNTKLKWILEKRTFEGKMFLTSSRIALKRKKQDKILFENIDSVKLSVNLKKNDFKGKLIIKKYIDSFQKNYISGYFHIADIYHQKKIKSEYNICNFPVSFVNFFIAKLDQVNGSFSGHIRIFGTFNQPKMSADINLKNIFVKSDNILRYITLFFPYFSGKIDNLKINQEITIKKGNVSFKLKSIVKDFNNIELEWNFLFHSEEILVLILPKITISLSSQLNLHYLHSKYDLIGFIRFFVFYFKINEKNFIF